MDGAGLMLEGREDKQTFPTKHSGFSQDFKTGGENIY